MAGGSQSLFTLHRSKGGPAPLYVNPAQGMSSLVALAKAVAVLLSVVGVIVNKLADETCDENFVGFFVTVGAVSLISAGVFLHLSMTSLAADTEWRIFLLVAVLVTVAEALIAAWGMIVWIKTSGLSSVNQCMEMTESDTCIRFARLRNPADCPGRPNFSDGDIDIDCEVDFLCRFQAPHTFGMGVAVSVLSALFAHATAWLVFGKFLPDIAVQGRELAARFKL